ncbi:hypothetical protein M409DRAFT_28056 [Zasmidium cellare ATCC 36951]|uniref:Uncharacterized protein n=1 Tax=Zasmidium cellare ATCC 36951 TaxID=1080233 RepID=A0A6A6C7E8_ZASCE|nr:uncharacterized protein M409DRAFT_28056 [Zasmidium cellare ATCC 36951]KAF2161659.1 hypothetical protein M409DRAFT_28056 [Zasmidium cellare ATCC 36951]
MAARAAAQAAYRGHPPHQRQPIVQQYAQPPMPQYAQPPMPGMQLVDPNDAAAFEGMRLTVAPDGSYAYLTPIHSPIVSDYSMSDASSGSFSPVPSIYHPKSPHDVSGLCQGDAHQTTGPPPTFGDTSHSWPMRKTSDAYTGQIQGRVSRSENDAFRERAFAERRRRQEAYKRCGKMELPKPAYIGKGKQRAVEPRKSSQGSSEKHSLRSNISRVSRRMKSIFSRSS